MIKSYRDLKVWQKAFQLCILVYKATESFPKSEIYGLTSQLRRCSLSIPSNIAEGYARGHRAEYIQFLRISYASAAELETQLLISKALKYLNDKEFEQITSLLEEVKPMLYRLMSSLK